MPAPEREAERAKVSRQRASAVSARGCVGISPQEAGVGEHTGFA